MLIFKQKLNTGMSSLFKVILPLTRKPYFNPTFIGSLRQPVW